MMEYEREIERALECLRINSGYEVPSDNDVLDARCLPFAPPTAYELKILEEHEESLRVEAEALEKILDEQLETLEEHSGEETGTETVNDYFTYSPNYNFQKNEEKKSFLNVQTLPSDKVKGIDEALRLDRCSSNDSGLGNSLGLFANSNAGLNSSETGTSTGSDSESKETLPPPPAQPTERKRFPRLGVSSYFIGAKNSGSSEVKSCESSENESSENVLPRTSTPQTSPSKPVEIPTIPPVNSQETDEVTNAADNELLPDFLNPCLPAGQPLPTVEDLLYPGISREITRDNKVRKMLGHVKTKTSAGLLKVKSSISELVKNSDKNEAELEKEIIEKISRISKEQNSEDFSMHMIEEPNFQRLTAVAPVAPIGDTLESSSRQRQFPPSGNHINQSAQGVSHHQMSPLLVPKFANAPANQNAARRARRSRRSAANDIGNPKTAENHGIKPSSRRRRAISEVRKRVQEAHIREQRLADLSKGLNPVLDGAVPFHHRVPRCYNGRKLVYTRQGQVPQYRNGQLDWNYLWFFSDSSTTTNSTGNEATQLNITSPLSSNETSDSESPETPDSRVASPGPSNRVHRAGNRSGQKSGHRVRSPTVRPNRVVSPVHSAQSPNVLKQAKKKRLRRMAPPSDENVQLLGMI